MNSQEMGLVLGQQLLGMEDLHYGLWDDDIELTIANIPVAQQRYTDFILSTLPKVGSAPVRILDIGCGTGNLMRHMLDKGYHVDGVSPSPSLSRKVRERLTAYPDNDTTLFECRFEALPAEAQHARYDVALFSESFQYINMKLAFELLPKLLKPGGIVVICDFFKTEAAGDGGPGDGSFGGGHNLKGFYNLMDEIPFKLVRDEDITKRVSLNLKLLNDVLMNRLQPTSETLGQYLGSRYPKSWKFITWLFRKRIDKLKFKYFSGHRSDKTFERYKSYHLFVLAPKQS